MGGGAACGRVSPAIHFRFEGYTLPECRWIQARGQCYGRSRLVDRLGYRRTVTLEIAVAAVDRLDRVTPPRERARAHLGAVARQRDIPQGGHPVVKCDTACGCVCGVPDM